MSKPNCSVSTSKATTATSNTKSLSSKHTALEFAGVDGERLWIQGGFGEQRRRGCSYRLLANPIDSRPRDKPRQIQWDGSIDQTSNHGFGNKLGIDLDAERRSEGEGRRATVVAKKPASAPVPGRPDSSS
jgi:hypothetical protein